jgi:thiamine biosynthesis lipoprotein
MSAIGTAGTGAPGTPGATAPATEAGTDGAGAAGELVVRGTAMATAITIRLPHAGAHPGATAAADAALEVFATIERSCTRFDPDSALMRANASPQRFHHLPPECLLAVREASAAHGATRGLFDPRVLDDLVGLGYDRTLAFAAGTPEVAGTVRRRRARPPWRPRFRGTGEVALGDHPIDLGGIGKGIAIRLAAGVLAGAGLWSFLVEAGGDLFCAGSPSEGGTWRIGVEDAFGGSEPCAVLELSGQACATSSLRVRRWRAGGRPAHHLIDPRSGLPGRTGLLAVTVVGTDPAWAEVWSKTLLLTGAAGIARRAQSRSLAALWVTEDGRLGWSRAIERRLLWLRDEQVPA